jgi:hypothetical protein
MSISYKPLTFYVNYSSSQYGTSVLQRCHGVLGVILMLSDIQVRDQVTPTVPSYGVLPIHFLAWSRGPIIENFCLGPQLIGFFYRLIGKISFLKFLRVDFLEYYRTTFLWCLIVALQWWVAGILSLRICCWKQLFITFLLSLLW